MYNQEKFQIFNKRRQLEKEIKDSLVRLSYSETNENFSHPYFDKPFTFVIRFEVSTQKYMQAKINKCNRLLRDIFNNVARKQKLKCNGYRYINIRQTINSYKIIYNLTFDNITSAVFVFNQICKANNNVAVLYKSNATEIIHATNSYNFRKTVSGCIGNAGKHKSVAHIRSNNVYLYLNGNNYHPEDFDPVKQAHWYFDFDKPRYRRKQGFGNCYHNETFINS